MGKIKLSLNENVIVVVGLPASGKSWVANELIEKYGVRNYKLYRTDDYIKYGFEESLYKMMDDLRRDLSPKKIIEGVQGYRLLRKGLEFGNFNPDVVIIVAASLATRQDRYAKRQAGPDGVKGKKINRGFDATLEKIWNDYLERLKTFESIDTLGQQKKPRFVIVNSEGGNNKHI